MNQFIQSQKDLIEKHGNSLIAVGASETSPQFIYTLGNAQRGLPELIIVGGFTPAVLGHALNQLSAKMRKDEKALPEGMVDIEWSFPFKVQKVRNLERTRDQFTCQAGNIQDLDDYEVLQVMICDKEGRYPGDPGCNPDFDIEQL